MSYNLVYTQRALRDIDKLESSIRRRIGRVLLRYQGNPMKHAERMKDPRLGFYRFRIGDYRVIFDLEGDEIVVLRVGHRREIYRR